MRRLQFSHTAFAILLASVPFFTFLLLCNPMLNSDDDLYILYTLAGGYSNPPTNLLHYFYTWNPFLFWPVSALFARFPGFNWYSCFLLLLQFCSMVRLAAVFLSDLPRRLAVMSFLVLFLFVGSPLLLSLNHSNTSLLLALAGCSSFLSLFAKGKIGAKHLLIPALLLLLGALVRFHVFAIVVSLAGVMGTVILPWQKWGKLVLHFAVVGGVVLGLLAIHYWFYTEKIPNYRAEEQYRDAVFKSANYPLVPQKDSGFTAVKNSFIQSLFLFDTSFVKKQDIDRYVAMHSSTRTNWTGRLAVPLYWMFVNLRVYLLLLLGLTVLLIALQNGRFLKRWLLLLLGAVVVFLLFFVFLKVTPWLFLAFTSSLFLSALFLLRGQAIKTTPFWVIAVSLLFLASAWMVVRIKKDNDRNEAAIRQTRAVLAEIKQHPGKLFLHTDSFQDRGFAIWDTPQQYPLFNFLNIGNLLTNTIQPTLHRFGVVDVLQSLSQNENLYIAGQNLPMVREYFRLVHGRNVVLQPVQGFRVLTVYRVVLRK